MTLIKYRNPMETYPASFSRMIDNLFNDKWLNDSPEDFNLRTFNPKVDIAEVENEYEVHLTVPGMKKDDFKIEVNENTLTISGERKFENEEKAKQFHSIESHYGKFARSFQLPKNVNQDKIKANYNDGILVVKLAKTEKSLEKVIKIQ
ncbi:MAG TPA: Hsp20/alpha crystallin family protein [Cyclobacteriaceae bacterium]|jgi:HSP20 family protein